MPGPGPFSKLVIDSAMSEGAQTPFLDGAAVVFSRPAPVPDRRNEDSALLVARGDGLGVLLVADGLGGQPGGQQASKLAVECMTKAILDAEDTSGGLRTAILDGLEHANEKVRGLGIGAATTVAALEITDSLVRPYHVGDSGITVVGQRTKLKLQTLAHSPVGYAVEAGLLDEDEALHHDDRHLISNMVGSEEMRIEIGSPLELAQRDTVLLATDGLLDNLSNAELAEAIRTGPLPEVAARLARVCEERMAGALEGQPSKPDDLTFILFRRGSPKPA